MNFDKTNTDQNISCMLYLLFPFWLLEFILLFTSHLILVHCIHMFIQSYPFCIFLYFVYYSISFLFFLFYNTVLILPLFNFFLFYCFPPFLLVCFPVPLHPHMHLFSLPNVLWNMHKTLSNMGCCWGCVL